MRLFERVIIDSRCRRHSFVVCRPRVSRALLFGKSWGYSQTEDIFITRTGSPRERYCSGQHQAGLACPAHGSRRTLVYDLNV